MMNQLLFKALALLACLSCALGVSANDFVYQNIYYNITSSASRTVEVTYGSNKYTGSVSIPSTVTYNGTTYQVKGIGKSAFKNCDDLTGVTIPNSVTIIDEDAFNDCDGLTSVNIPGSVTTIGYMAFRFCRALTSLTLNYGLKTIGERAFEYFNATSVTIPNSVTLIGDYAFAWSTKLQSVTIGTSSTTGNITIGYCAFDDCTNLTSLSLGNSVTTIDNGAFFYCGKLTSLIIPKSVTSIGSWAFSACSGLESVTVASGNTVFDSRNNCNAIIETATNTLHTGCANTVIPTTVTAIGDNAFNHCIDLTGITIPNSVTSIGESAFMSCWYLESITIPKSVTSIGNMAFSYCASLLHIDVANGNPVYDSRGNCNAIIETATNTLIAGSYYTVIPNTVTAIGDYAFANNCIRNVVIPNSVTCIGDSAFAYCYSLENLTIGKNVTTFGDDAFMNCSGLENVYSLSTTPRAIGDIFIYEYDSDRIYQQATLWVPKNSVNAYKNANIWKKFSAIKAIVPGDLDADGTLNVSDVTALISMVLGNIPANPALGDLNGDGLVNVADVTALITLVLNS